MKYVTVVSLNVPLVYVNYACCFYNYTKWCKLTIFFTSIGKACTIHLFLFWNLVKFAIPWLIHDNLVPVIALMHIYDTMTTYIFDLSGATMLLMNIEIPHQSSYNSFLE